MMKSNSRQGATGRVAWCIPMWSRVSDRAIIDNCISINIIVLLRFGRVHEVQTKIQMRANPKDPFYKDDFGRRDTTYPNLDPFHWTNEPETGQIFIALLSIYLRISDDPHTISEALTIPSEKESQTCNYRVCTTMTNPCVTIKYFILFSKVRNWEHNCLGLNDRRKNIVSHEIRRVFLSLFPAV
jgi:hypothetical protein